MKVNGITKISKTRHFENYIAIINNIIAIVTESDIKQTRTTN